MCNPCKHFGSSCTVTYSQQSVISYSFAIFSSCNPFVVILQMQSFWILSLFSPPSFFWTPGPLTKKHDESTMNRPRDEGILIACFFFFSFFYLMLHFRNSMGKCCVCMCVNNHLRLTTLCARYTVHCQTLLLAHKSQKVPIKMLCYVIILHSVIGPCSVFPFHPWEKKWRFSASVCFCWTFSLQSKRDALSALYWCSRNLCRQREHMFAYTNPDVLSVLYIT